MEYLKAENNALLYEICEELDINPLPIQIMKVRIHIILNINYFNQN